MLHRRTRARRSPRWLPALCVLAAGLASSLASCSGPPPSAPGEVARDAGGDAARDATTTPTDTSDAGAPSLTALAIRAGGAAGAGPVLLVPAFSPEIHDYYVRCASGPNALTVELTASTGATDLLLQPFVSPSSAQQTIALTVLEDQPIVAAATRGSVSSVYWVRCLPHDFPQLAMTAHSEVGVPPPGYYLVGDFAPTSKAAFAMVLDGHGVPVWYHRGDGSGMCDVDSVAAGAVSFVSTLSEGFDVIELGPWRARYVRPPEASLDGHELRFLPNGDALFFADVVRTGVDLTGLHFGLLDGGVASFGPGSSIQDCVVNEVDPAGNPVWQWSAYDHFDPVTTTTFPWFSVTGDTGPDGGAVIDTFHCNSIDVDPGSGDLLISARDMDSAFYVDRATGAVLWKMGGKASSRDDTRFVSVADPFFRQHDARFQPGWSSTCQGGAGSISMFDDHYFEPGVARAIVYDILVGGEDAGCPDGGTSHGEIAGTATARWQFAGKVTSLDMGSFRISPDGSRVVGWGTGAPNLVFTEVDIHGNDLLDFEFTDGNTSYRAIKVPTTALNLDAMRATAGLP